MQLLENKMIRFISRALFPKTIVSEKHFPGSTGISPEESEFFVKNGYLVKTDSVPKSVIEGGVNYGWSLCPKHFDRNNRKTWDFPITGNPKVTNIDNKGKVLFSGFTQAGLPESSVSEREPWLKEIFFEGSCIQSTVSAMMGADRTPVCPVINGIFFTFPVPTSRLVRPYIHTDSGPDIVRFLIYLSDVKPGSGGFHVWPGSHFPMSHVYNYEAGGEMDKSKYWNTMYKFASTTPAVEIAAPAGTVIFWHHRLAHAAGINRSSEVRQVFIAGYPSLDIGVRDKIEVPVDPWAYWAISNG